MLKHWVNFEIYKGELIKTLYHPTRIAKLLGLTDDEDDILEMMFG